MGFYNTHDDIIKRFKCIHGDTYIYDNVKYKKQTDAVEIICKTHGLFLQKPKHHLKGKGCPLCNPFKKMTFDDVINKANIIHNFKYEYLKSDIIKGNKSYIDITCKIHGNFKQRVDKHLQGHGCPKCSNIVSINENRLFNELVNEYPNLKQSDRNLLNGLELDIVNYETKRAIEFNGDYWHCNPKIYNEHFYNKRNKMFAKDIWEKDKYKIKLANDFGVKVFTVWESEFLKDPNKTINHCFKFIGGF